MSVAGPTIIVPSGWKRWGWVMDSLTCLCIQSKLVMIWLMDSAMSSWHVTSSLTHPIFLFLHRCPNCRSHCDCDEDFMRCLRQANSKSAERLGNFYFNILKVQCIKEEKSFICAKYMWVKVTIIMTMIRYNHPKLIQFTHLINHEIACINPKYLVSHELFFHFLNTFPRCLQWLSIVDSLLINFDS